MRLPTLVLSLAGLTACGGGSDGAGEPLISGSLTAHYDGVPFTPINGVATIYNGGGLIMLGDGPIHCGTEDSNTPPRGDNAVFSVPLTVGSYGSVLVQLFHNDGNFEGLGSSTGVVNIVGVTETSVAGDIAFAFTSTDGTSVAIDGTFEVIRCAE